MSRKRERKLILCECGCGELIPNINKMGYYARFKHGHHVKAMGFTRGEKQHLWKGGRRKHTSGYILILKPEHPFATKAGYVPEHRLIVEEYLGRYLKEGEHVHHINGNKKDNRVENLQIMTNAEHIRFHRLQDLAKGINHFTMNK